jgi:DNA-binding MarR family transcriptional regulator
MPNGILPSSAMIGHADQHHRFASGEVRCMIRREVMKAMFFDPQHRKDDRASRISMMVYRLTQAVKAMNQEEGDKLGLSPVQIQAILFIRHTRPDMATVGQFAHAIGSSHVTAVKILRGIVDKGLASKVRSESDRRISLLALTPEGLTAASRLEKWGNGLHSVMETLDEATLVQLGHGLEQLAAGLKRRGRFNIAEPCEGCVHFMPHAAEGEHPHYCQLIRKYLTHEATLQECPEHTALR